MSESELYFKGKEIPATPTEMVEQIRLLEDRIKERPQLEFNTEHVFHAGLYSRTVRIPAGVLFTSVLVKIPTMVIINGICDALLGDSRQRIHGYNVIPAAAGRKQVYVTLSNTELTMVFHTSATTVEEAEAEFTDETEFLMSHGLENDIVKTEGSCLESPPQLHS